MAKLNQDFKKVTNVYSTTKYDTLVLYKANRKIRKAQERAIGKSMIKYGNITVGLVALINGVYYVLDGQHRLETCKENKIPFEFKLITLKSVDLISDIMIALNCNGKRWAEVDYLSSFANEGKKPYVWLTKVMEDYPNLNISTLKKIYGVTTQKFRSGKWEISNEDFIKATRIVKQVSQVLPIMFTNGKLNAQPLRSVISIMKHEQYLHNKFISRVKNYNGEFNKDEKTLKDDLLNLISY